MALVPQVQQVQQGQRVIRALSVLQAQQAPQALQEQEQRVPWAQQERWAAPAPQGRRERRGQLALRGEKVPRVPQALLDLPAPLQMMCLRRM